MILDAFVQFTGGTASPGNSDGATDSPTTGTQTSSNQLDLHISGGGLPVLAANQGARDIGIGDDPALKISIIVTVAFTGGASLQANLQGAPDNGSGAPGSFSTFVAGAVILEAQLTVGAYLLPIDMPRPPQGVSMPRFLQLQYVTSGTHTGGKVRGNIVIDRFDQPYNGTTYSTLGGYPPGITIAN